MVFNKGHDLWLVYSSWQRRGLPHVAAVAFVFPALGPMRRWHSTAVSAATKEACAAPAASQAYPAVHTASFSGRGFEEPITQNLYKP